MLPRSPLFTVCGIFYFDASIKFDAIVLKVIDFKLLRTKRRQLYIKTQSVPRSKHFPPRYKNRSLGVLQGYKLMFLSERREFLSAPCPAGKKNLDDSSRLHVVEIARVPDMLQSLFSTWSG